MTRSRENDATSDRPFPSAWFDEGEEPKILELSIEVEGTEPVGLRFSRESSTADPWLSFSSPDSNRLIERCFPTMKRIYSIRLFISNSLDRSSIHWALQRIARARWSSTKDYSLMVEDTSLFENVCKGFHIQDKSMNVVRWIEPIDNQLNKTCLASLFDGRSFETSFSSRVSQVKSDAKTSWRGVVSSRLKTNKNLWSQSVRVNKILVDINLIEFLHFAIE